jgi:hypothetical protein
MKRNQKNAREAADKAWATPEANKARPSSGIQYRCMADIQPIPIRWLWPGLIARGKITIIAGNPGLGKSQLTANVTAIVTRGALWPADGGRCEIGSVAFICAEDDAADTIRPRLEATGADAERVFILDSVSCKENDGKISQRSFSLQKDIEQLDLLLAEKPDIALVVIDPITAYMGSVDSHKTTDVRGVLSPLAEMAARRNVAVVCVSHLNKSGDTDAMMRVTGSLAYVAAARAAYLVAADQENPTRRLFLPMKNNLGSDRTGLAFGIEPFWIESHNINTSRVVWENEVITQTANDVLAAQPTNEEHTAVDEAKDFLTEVLTDAPLNAKEVQRQATEAGIAKRTLMRAKDALGIKPRKIDMDKGWVWELPKNANDAEECQP